MKGAGGHKGITALWGKTANFSQSETCNVSLLSQSKLFVEIFFINERQKTTDIRMKLYQFILILVVWKIEYMNVYSACTG
jgi:hypothetical protein